MWLVGLLRLVFAFHRTWQSAAAQQLKDRLREQGAVPELYTYSKFTHPCAVSGKFKFPKLNNAGYAEIDKEAAFCYIGSTNLTRSDQERIQKSRTTSTTSTTETSQNRDRNSLLE